MAYSNTIPAQTDILADSQPQLLENFAQIETQFSVDHSSLLVTVGNGKHRQITLPELGADPTTTINEGVLYTKDSGTQTELYYKGENNTSSVIQITKNGYVNTFIKAFGTFTTGGAIVGTAFNFNAATVAVVSGQTTYTLSFINRPLSATYAILATPVYVSGNIPSVIVKERNRDDFKLIIGAGATGSYSFSVVVLRIA